MKTKLVKFEAPKESTIYNPPLKMVNEVNREYHLLAYVANAEYCFVCNSNSFGKFKEFFIEVPDEPQRMNVFQLMQLLSRGWIFKDNDGYVSNKLKVEPDELYLVLSTKTKVSRIDKIEWIEPTTDLLDL